MEMFKITYIILIIMNDKKYGICGIDCSKCPAYIATINDDNVLREKTAKVWSKLYGINLKHTELWDKVKSQWNRWMNKDGKLKDSDRYAHAQLSGVLAEYFVGDKD